VVCCWLWPSHAAAATDVQSRTIALPPTRTLSLEITIGVVAIVGSSRTDAQIEIVRRAPKDVDLTRIPVTVQESDREVRVQAVQADGRTDPELRTDVTLHVPRNAHLGPIRIVEGRATLSSLHGSITLTLRRGPIEANDVSGAIRLEAEIGSLVVNRARLSADGVLRLRTFNGDIKLTLAERPIDARILAVALNGSIASDIPLNMKDKWGPRSGEATLGRGEPVISLDVVTGRIEIRSP
jgi:DUF4097 and DUF4098 domain-containing protein YvlB